MENGYIKIKIRKGHTYDGTFSVRKDGKEEWQIPKKKAEKRHISSQQYYEAKTNTKLVINSAAV